MTDAESVGRTIYERCKLSPEDPPRGGAATLARLLRVDIRSSLRAQTEAELGRIGPRPVIAIHPRLSPQRLNFAVAQMLARLELGPGSPLERHVAAYLVAPSEAFDPCVDVTGANPRQLALPFAITETCAALRIVERGHADGVVVTPDRVYRPGKSLSWISEKDVRALAQSSPRNLKKILLTDEPGRVALYRA